MLFVLCGVVWCIVCVSVCVRVRACVRGWVWVGGWARARALAVCAVVRTGRSLARTWPQKRILSTGRRLEQTEREHIFQKLAVKFHTRACVRVHTLEQTPIHFNGPQQTRADSSRLEQARREAPPRGGAEARPTGSLSATPADLCDGPPPRPPGSGSRPRLAMASL